MMMMMIIMTVTYREYYTRCCINTIRHPDDEHSVARNMWKIIIINILYKVIVHQVGHLPRVVAGCTVSKTWNTGSVYPTNSFVPYEVGRMDI